MVAGDDGKPRNEEPADPAGDEDKRGHGTGGIGRARARAFAQAKAPQTDDGVRNDRHHEDEDGVGLQGGQRGKP